MRADLKDHCGAVPTHMLKLMQELEKQGPHFAQKPIITIVGAEDRELVYQVT